jgi:hypothetical protein
MPALDSEGRYPEAIGPEGPAERVSMRSFARGLLDRMDEQDGHEAIADVIASVGFLFADHLPDHLAERLADPDPDLIERVQRLCIIRAEAEA